MALYTIKEETLTDIADALREKLGTYYMASVTAPALIINRTSSYGSGFSRGTYKPYTISGASTMYVSVKYQTSADTAFIQVMSGNVTETPEGTEKLCGGTYGTQYLKYYTFENTDTITIYDEKDANSFGYGFYITVIGADKNGNFVGDGTIVDADIQLKRTYTSSDIAPTINSMPPTPTEEAFVISGNCECRFANGWDWFLEKYADRITTKDITKASHMFANCNYNKPLLFDINFANGCDVTHMFHTSKFTKIPSIDFKQTDQYRSTSNIFRSAARVEEIGTIKNLYPNSLDGIFADCQRLKAIPEFENLNLTYMMNSGSNNYSNMFNGCYSVRSIPKSLLKILYNDKCTSYYYSFLNGAFRNCYVLNEIVGLSPITGAISSTALTSSLFSNCYMLKNFIFDTQEDGTPYVVKWKSQKLSFNKYIGYAVQYDILNYNSGITLDTKVTDDASYQALKNNPDWWTDDQRYSKYNHNSAVLTINSLPDTSEYVAGSSLVNTIVFSSICGELTDEGGCGNLTEEEIAVAAAKGWTVSFV